MKIKNYLYLLILVALTTACGGTSVVFTVNSNGDEPDNNINDGICETVNNECTLRAALMEVNAGNNISRIEFDNVSTISPATALPPLTVALVSIDGGGAVTLDGGQFGDCNGFAGIEIQGTSLNKIQGLTIVNFGTGIYINGLNGGGGANTIGFDPNSPPDATMRNVIGGNCRGIYIRGQNAVTNTIAGNFIGTLADGFTANPNQNGIIISNGSHDNLIGSTSALGSGSFNLTDLSAFWEMDEANGTRFDSYGSNHLSESGNVGQVAGIVNNAADFEANNNEFLNIGDNAELSLGADQAFSITVWVKPESNKDSNSIVSKKASGIEGSEYRLRLNSDGTASGIVADGTSFAIVSTTDTINAGNWGMVFFYHDPIADEIGISINGGSIVATAWSSGTQDTSDSLRVGRRGGNYFDGVIDNLSFWKRALSPSESNTLYLNNGDPLIAAEALGGNVISGNTGAGIDLGDTTGNHITGNLIGIAQDGQSPLGNAGGGIWMDGGANNNTIGVDATGEGAGNIISDNGFFGIRIQASINNIVAGNYIGTNIDGTVAMGNDSDGVALGTGAIGNVVGTNGDGIADDIEGNIVAASGQHGIRLDAANNVVAGNYIGTNFDGSSALGNNNVGVSISANGNRVGTNGDGNSDSQELNLISGNGIGVAVHSSSNQISGNLIGTDLSGLMPLGNHFFGIILYSNATLNLIGSDGDGSQDGVERNIISANGGVGGSAGIRLQGSSNVVAGNYIGTDLTGNAALGNVQYGILLSGNTASSNLIGTDGDGIADIAERNIISGNGWNGILMSNASSNQVSGNLIGTDATGSFALPNGHAYNGDIGAVAMNGGASSNVIGTDGDGSGDAVEGNVISGNVSSGVRITGQGSTNNIVAGNYLGTDISGTAPLGNFTGVRIVNGASANRIGTDDDGTSDLLEANVISDNTDGVHIFIAPLNEVSGNFIGTDAAGTSPIGNARYGIQIGSSNLGGADGNKIGGTPDKANVIAFNGWEGVRITGASMHPVNTPILFNSIFSNGSFLGINLQPGDLLYGITPNDSGDADSGANDLINFPELTSALAIGNSIAISGEIVDGLSNTTFQIQFFSNPTCDISSGHGEGQVYLGQSNEMTDGNGDVGFLVNLAQTVIPGHFISATATNNNNTSEFSACIEVIAGQNLSQDLDEPPDFFIVPTRNLNCRYFCSTQSDIADTLFEGIQYIPIGWDPLSLHFAFRGPVTGSVCFAPPLSGNTSFMALDLGGEALSSQDFDLLTLAVIPRWTCPDLPTPTPEATDVPDDREPDEPTDTPEPALPQCSDGIDNDGDGRIDYGDAAAIAGGTADRECSSPDDDNEAEL